MEDRSDVLLISPYTAQIRHFGHLVREALRVGTIDGCQGIQASVAIISFVSLDSSNSEEAPFALEMRRLNVALSRARQRLYLVGNWKYLKKAALQRHAQPHVIGLSRFFDESQKRGKVRSMLEGAVPTLTK